MTPRASLPLCRIGTFRVRIGLRRNPWTTRQNIITPSFRRGIAYDDRELYASLYPPHIEEREKKAKEDYQKSHIVGDLELSDAAIAALDASEIDKAIRHKFGRTPAGASILENIRWQHLSEGRSCWGWRIYRTTYKSTDDWTRFMEIFNGVLKANIVASHGHDDHMRFMNWSVVEDKSSLNGASSIVLREHFFNWRENDQIWQRDAMYHAAPIYDFFLSVDEESLQSVLDADGTRGRIGYVNLVQVDWPPAVDWERENIEADDGYDAIEGMTTHDVGFQRVALGSVYPDLFEETRELERRLFYIRPPELYPRYIF